MKHRCASPAERRCPSGLPSWRLCLRATVPTVWSGQSRRVPPGSRLRISRRTESWNRRLAEALAKCGLIERSGQGMNLIFETAIRQGKALPSFAGTTGVRKCVLPWRARFNTRP